LKELQSKSREIEKVQDPLEDENRFVAGQIADIMTRRSKLINDQLVIATNTQSK